MGIRSQDRKFNYKLAWFERLIAHARRTHGERRTRGAGWRLQCRADSAGHLSELGRSITTR